jgi:hypothetical protein
MSVVHLSPAAKRWQEIVSDPELSQRLERIETDVHGQITMAPPPDFIHRAQAKEIQAQLDRLLGRSGPSLGNRSKLRLERLESPMWSG